MPQSILTSNITVPTDYETDYTAYLANIAATTQGVTIATTVVQLNFQRSEFSYVATCNTVDLAREVAAKIKAGADIYNDTGPGMPEIYDSNY